MIREVADYYEVRARQVIIVVELYRSLTSVVEICTKIIVSAISIYFAVKGPISDPLIPDQRSIRPVSMKFCEKLHTITCEYDV